jgi:hypothetical protein
LHGENWIIKQTSRILVMRYTAIIILLMLSASRLQAQDAAAVVRSEYDSYRSKLTSTKAYVILPQQKYSPGDTIFFTAYFLTEDGMFVSGWQIIRVALVNDQGSTVHRQLVSVNNGIGANQVILPSAIREGNYTFVAYNDYMKMSDRRHYFRKKIQIAGKNSIKTENDLAQTKISAEGGHFIAGISNRVSISAPWAKQKVVIIKTSSGSAIAQATSDSYGTATFIIAPDKQEMYVAEIDNNRFDLPKVEEDGCVINLSPLYTRGELNMGLFLPKESVWSEQPVAIALTVNGQLITTASTKFSKTGQTMIRLSKVQMPQGLAEITVIGVNKKVLASRMFYNNTAPLFTCQVDIIESSSKKISAEVTLLDATGKPVASHLTVSAVNGQLHEDGREGTLNDYLNLPTELSVWSAAKSTDREWLTAIDNFMIVQHALMPWELILKDKDPEVKGPPKFVQVSGRAYFADSGKPVPDSTVLSGYMKNNRFAFENKTGKNGELDLAFLSLDGADEMFYHMESNGVELENVKIAWQYDSLLPFRAEKSSAMPTPDVYSSFIAQKRAIDKSFGFFGGVSRKDESENFDSSLEGDFRNTGTTVNVQDYRIFPTVQELLREIIPRLYHRRQGGKDIVRVSFNDAMIQPTSSPLYIIDGVLTKNTSAFLALDPANVITIKVIFDPAELSRFQAIARNGIVIVKTKKGAGIPPTSLVSLNGFNPTIPFRNPKEKANDSHRKPEFRSIIYWNPDVRTEKTGKATINFYTTDDQAPIRLTIRGLAGGQEFEVVKVIR